MVKKLLTLFVLVLVVAYNFNGKNEKAESHSTLSTARELLESKFDSHLEVVDEVLVKQSAFSKNLVEISEEGKVKKNARAVKIQAVIKEFQFDRISKNVAESIRTQFEAGNILNENNEDAFEGFLQSIHAFPHEKYLKQIFKDYSEEELDYLLGQFSHSVNGELLKIQNENIKEMNEISQQTEPYNVPEDKSLIIEEILETTNSVESADVTSSVMTRSVLMVMGKLKNPKANQSEIDGFANEAFESMRSQHHLSIKNSLNWSFSKLSEKQLGNYLAFVRENNDSRLNDKVRGDSKKFYAKYGDFLGKEMFKLFEQIK